MDSVLSPREIQTRIRSGASLEDVVAAAGLPPERVERFAAPVLAEREHVAEQARSASVRRRGETSGHRTLRAVLSDRLRSRGLDADSATWDSYRLETGRWAVVATYEQDGESRQAVFHFDLQGRFSVAANDHARWVLGETAAGGAAVPATPDTEPTIDLSDDLAIVRAVQEPPVEAGAAAEAEVLASVQPIRPDVAPVPKNPPSSPPAHQATTRRATAHQATGPIEPTRPEEPSAPVAGEEAARASRGHRPTDEPSPIATLYEMLGYEPLGGDGYSEDSPRVYAGLSGSNTRDQPAAAQPGVGDPTDVARIEEQSTGSPAAPTAASAGGSDAVAVPEAVAARGAGWEPAIVVAYPVEPGAGDEGEAVEVEVPESSDDPGRAEPPVAIEDRHTEAEALEDEQDEHQQRAAMAGRVTGATPADTDTEGGAPADDNPALIDAPPRPAAPKPATGRRRRASVPSWDEIMFGGPKKQ